MTDEEYSQAMKHELASAEIALRAGNTGMVRVCARRAAGLAIRWFLERRPQAGWKDDMMWQLQRISTETSFPESVREAARRLCAHVTPDFSYHSSATPLSDAREIIGYVSATLTEDDVR